MYVRAYVSVNKASKLFGLESQSFAPAVLRLLVALFF